MHIIATVPQGVGDIFWCYQKLKPHADEITFRIAVLDDKCQVQRRAENIIRELPGVRDIQLKKLANRDYTRLISGRFDLPLILQRLGHRSEITIDYSVNHQLDNGVPLEKIDSLPVMYDIPASLQEYPISGPFVLMYASGSTADASVRKRLHLWTPRQWADLANTISNRSGLPVYFIGAEFDAAVMREIKMHNPRVGLIIQPPAAQLFWLLKNASAFVGYQSGLSILADNFNTRQLIVYFHTLRNMRDSWVKPQNRNDLFRFCYFDDGPEHAAAMVC
jgi:hypothetical protein